MGEHEPSHPALLVPEPIGEPGHVLDLGAPEAVDRLVRVGGHGEPAMPGREPVQQLGLGGRGVLVLVDEHERVALRHRPAHPVVAEQLDGGAEQRAVVDPPSAIHLDPHPADERRQRPPLRVTPREGLQLGGTDEPLLAAEQEVGHVVGQRRRSQQAPEAGRPRRRILGGEELGDEGDVLGPRQQRGRIVPAVGLEDPPREGVEGRGRQRPDRAAQPGEDPSAQVGRRPAGEGEDQQLVRPGSS